MFVAGQVDALAGRASATRSMRYLPRFIEVWVTASLDEYRLRDAKRLYAQFAGGDVRGMPGEHAIYEAPELAEVTQGRATRTPYCESSNPWQQPTRREAEQSNGAFLALHGQHVVRKNPGSHRL